MAEPARDWQILETLQARLQQISIAAGFRTDAGADVRLEGDATAVLAPLITLYSASRTRPADARTRGEREFTLIVEARVPSALDAPQQTAVAIDADLEQALDGYVQQPMALPLEFVDAVILDRPEGVPEVVVQQMYVTRYRR